MQMRDQVQFDAVFVCLFVCFRFIKLVCAVGGVVVGENKSQHILCDHRLPVHDYTRRL